MTSHATIRLHPKNKKNNTNKKVRVERCMIFLDPATFWECLDSSMRKSAEYLLQTSVVPKSPLWPEAFAQPSAYQSARPELPEIMQRLEALCTVSLTWDADDILAASRIRALAIPWLVDETRAFVMARLHEPLCV